MKMKKKLVQYFSLLLCVVLMLGTFVACGMQTSVEKGEKGEKGENGIDGKDGINGQNGINGITPTFKVEDGALFVSYDDGETWQSLGNIAGTNGTNGTNGKDGVSIQSVTVDEAGRLAITLSDGTKLPPIELPQVEKESENSKLFQEANEAFISYLIDNGGESQIADCYFYEADEAHIVAFQNGKIVGVYADKENAKKALFDDADTEIDESQNYVIVKMTDTDFSVCCKDFSKLNYVTFGDSITIGVDVYSEHGVAYPQMVGEALNFQTVDNRAISGGTLCANSGRTNMTANILSFNGDADVISVMLGVNDYQMLCPLGTPESRDNTTIYGSLHLIASHLTTNFSDAFVFFITPFPYRGGDRDRGAGYNLLAVVEAVKAVAAEYGIPVLDMYTLGKYELEMNDSKNDGIHPTYKHHKEYTAPIVAEFIVKNYVRNDEDETEEILPEGTILYHRQQLKQGFYYTDGTLEATSKHRHFSLSAQGIDTITITPVKAGLNIGLCYVVHIAEDGTVTGYAPIHITDQTVIKLNGEANGTLYFNVFGPDEGYIYVDRAVITWVE